MAHSMSSDDELTDNDLLQNEPDQSSDGDDGDEDVDVVSFVKIEKERVNAALLRLEDLGPDDEVWTLTVPKHLNIDNLHDQDLSFKGKSTGFIDVENRRYETSIAKKKSTMTMLLPDENGKIHPVSVQRRGEIVLRESVETPGAAGVLVLPDKPVQPAGEVQRRHPFFVLGDIPNSDNQQAGAETPKHRSKKSKAIPDATETPTPTKKRRSKL